MGSEPIVSVIIPTCNRAQSLRRCLESLGSQTFQREDYEVIVVDDGSDDETADVVQQARGAAKARYLRQLHGGSALARNHGAEVAQGDIVLFFDDDVIADSDLLRSHVEAHRRFGRVAVLGFTPFAEDLPTTSIMEYHRNRWFDIFGQIAEQEKQHGSLPFKFFITLNLSVQRADFNLLGPFDSTFNAAFEDTELGLRFSQAAIPLRFCAQARAWHRPYLDERSLTVRQEQFGYRAGRYYLAHPDNSAMNDCMNVSYVLGDRDTDRLHLSERKARLRRLLLTDSISDLLLLCGTRGGRVIPKALRSYLFKLVVGHYYGKGFLRALKEHGISLAVCKPLFTSANSPNQEGI